MKSKIKEYIWIILFLLFTIISYFIGFQPGMKIYSNFSLSFIEMISFIPLLFVIVGLFDVWVPKKVIEANIGKSSGLKGIFFVIMLAMLQAGPLYSAFPVAYILYKKGASIRNIFIYLGAFSSLKIPMLGLEIGYLGLEFTIIRTLFSLPLFIFLGYFMEYILGKDYIINDLKTKDKNKNNITKN